MVVIQMISDKCPLCGGNEFTARLCAAWGFRPDVAATDIMQRDRRIAELEAQLELVKALQDKWRVEFINPNRNEKDCADELQQALEL